MPPLPFLLHLLLVLANLYMNCRVKLWVLGGFGPVEVNPNTAFEGSLTIAIG